MTILDTRRDEVVPIEKVLSEVTVLKETLNNLEEVQIKYRNNDLL